MALDLSGSDFSLASADTPNPGAAPDVPGYISGADNHNIGNTGGGSWLDPSTWESKFEGAGKFIATSLLSGADSLYNSAATVGNFFGADAQLSDTQAWITSLDQDLGQYYSQNRQAVDLAGFVATSFIPGMGGVKVLNAGQAALRAAKGAGLIGENLARYTSLLAPSTEAYVKLAGQEINAAQTLFNTINVNTAKALGAGLVQNTLEAAAFETFVQASMFKSPVLEGQDNWDIAKNILIGGALGGVIGGSFEAARSLGAIKKGRIAEDARIKNFSSREIVQPGTTPADRIILGAENRTLTPEPSAPELFNTPALRDAQLANARVAAAKKSSDIDLDTRKALHEMNSGASTDLINAVADTQIGLDTPTALRNWDGAVEITRPLNITKAEAAATKDLTPGFQSRYVELAGENAGRVSYELPAVLDAADRLVVRGNQSISDAVLAASKDQGFTTGKLWNPLDNTGKLSWREAELRHIWADNLKSVPADISVHANDIPLLERLFKDNRTDFKVVPGKNLSEAFSFNTTNEFKSWLIGQKEDLANDLLGVRLKQLIANKYQYRTGELTDSTAAPAQGSTRLYRADSPTTKFDDVFNSAGLDEFKRGNLKGTRYTNDPKYADYFKKSYGKDAKTSYIDVPTAELDKYKLNDYEFVVNNPKQPALTATTDPIETTTAAIAKTVNVKQAYLEGTRNTTNPDSDLFAWQSLSNEIHTQKVAAGLRTPSSDVTPSYLQPKVAKINYQADNSIGSDGHILDAMTFIKSRQKILHDDAVRVVAKQAGNAIADRMVDINAADLARTNSYGAGPGMLTSAQARYGSVEGKVQYLGGVSKDLQIAKRAVVDDTAQSALYQLANNKAAAIEHDTINQLLSRTSEQYVFDDAGHLGMGENVLIPKKVRDAFVKAGDDGDVATPTLQPGAPQYIQIQNWETANAMRASNSLTRARTIAAQERNAALGKLDQRDPDVIRPIRPNPKDFPFFAFVKDPKVTGAGHTSMLFANSEHELQGLITKTQRDFPDLAVVTKKDTADWFEAHQSYEYERGLNENYIDSNLASKGIYSNFYTRSDPQAIANDVLQYHYKGADIEAAEVMRLRYGEVFDWLENQAQSYSGFESSKFAGGKLETIAQNEKNPYLSYIKTALNLSSTPTSNPWWSMNKFFDTQVSKAVGKIRQAWDTANSPTDLGAVNALMEKYGSQTAFNSAAEAALINHTAPKAELSKFVRGANAIMSRFTLGLDPLNSLNNAIGANVLRTTELAQFTKAINNGNNALAGDLANLAKVTVPGTNAQILSAPKLIVQSIQRFFSPAGDSLLAEYKNIGVIRDRLQQFKSMADDLSLRGTETVPDLNSRLQSAFTKAKALADKGESLTGNKFAEEFNRFISADVMRQITDLGEQHGLLTKQESLTYINTFVNRVEGNVIASQRPGLFQGPLGQAIGLFQSYQFNLLQQLFRYVAEGEKKDLGMLLGLQGTFYGLNGEPGFKFINDHIVGTASGNQNHRDIYDATRGIAGKTAGDWLLYGTASNLMQTNIYSRGDINPRSITVVPTNIADVPFVGGMAKVFGTLATTAQKISNGGAVWESILSGIEHNGVSRPMAGLAQVARSINNSGTVFSTSSKGSILGSNDLMSLASLSRLAGGRPLDEAIQNDTMFSINSYEAVDRAKKDLLAETVKSTLVGKNNSPDSDQLTSFAQHYNYLGGKQGSFVKYMMEQYTKANTSQAEIMTSKLNNPLSYKIQALMGGASQ